MTDLYSSVVTLHALSAGTLPKTQGHLAHGAFLEIVNQVDSNLAQALHDLKANKPFTLSEVYGLAQARNGEVRLRAGQECWWRVTLAGEVLFGKFIERFLHGGARPTICLDEMSFVVSAVMTTPESHAWAGYTTTEEILEKASDEDRLMLEFASPVGFSFGNGRIEILPRADLVFSNLSKKWEAWCGSPLAASPLDEKWLRENVLTAGIQLKSRMVGYGKRLHIGATGTLMYQIFNADDSTRRAINTLADFAFYAGVGHKTTQGMGQVRRVVKHD